MRTLLDDWRQRSACRFEDARLFFPGSGCGQRVYEAPRAICGRCTVKAECLESVIDLRDGDDQVGMFGGLTPDERKEMRRCRSGACDHGSHRGAQ